MFHFIFMLELCSLALHVQFSHSIVLLVFINFLVHYFKFFGSVSHVLFVTVHSIAKIMK